MFGKLEKFIYPQAQQQQQLNINIIVIRKKMTKTQRDKPLIETLKGKKNDRPPFWFMRQAGRYLPEYRALRSEMGGFWDLVYTPEKAAQVTLQPIERFGMDGAILFSDILVVPGALGQNVTFKEEVGPVLDPLNFDLENFGLGTDQMAERMNPIFETIRTAKKKLNGETALIGFAGSPGTVATYMVESKGTPEKTKTLSFVKDKPEKFQNLISLIVDTTVYYLSEQVKAGAEALQLFDSWASALKSEDEFHTWSIAPTREIVRRMKIEAPDIPLIGFPKGAGEFYKEYFRQTGLDAISIDYDVDPMWAANELQTIGCVQGNLNPALLVEGGDAMLNQANIILEAFSGGPHVFNLGHGIVPQTPPENVEALSRFLKTA